MHPEPEPDPTAELISVLTERGLTIAVAESLTGGMLTAALVRVPGASAVVRGGIIAYHTALKHSLLGVDAALLTERGPVHPQVAQQMAAGVRERLSIDGLPADIGIATTGVAGPDQQGGMPVGTVFLGLSFGEGAESQGLRLDGARNEVRAAAVDRAVEWLLEVLGGLPQSRE